MRRCIKSSTKIRFLHLGSPSGLYGAERWILALVKHLPRQTVESYVGVIKDEPNLKLADLCKYAQDIGLQVVQFEAHGKLSLSAI